MVLENHELSFYTDHKVRDNPSSKPLSIYCVLQSTISPYTKDKKKSVFQVKMDVYLSPLPYYTLDALIRCEVHVHVHVLVPDGYDIV